MEEYRYLFKIVMIGDAGVGKTCLVRRFAEGVFPAGQGATIGVDFMIKNVDVKNDRVKLQIWDTAGQERFRCITQTYYHSAHALILVYDVSNKTTFESLEYWLKEVDLYAKPNVPCCLVGNKSDVPAAEREVSTEAGQRFAETHQLTFVETSARDFSNVERVFEDVAAGLTVAAKHGEVEDLTPKQKKIVIDNKPVQSRSWCCGT